jgi:hypothetical protein
MTDYNSDQVNIYIEKKRKSRFMFPLIIIIVVVAIVMPIYGTTLRYQVSASIRLMCDYLGNIFQQCGWFLLTLTILQALFRRINLKWMTYGIILLYVGAFLMGGTLSIFGLTIYEPISNPGFH